MKKQLVYIKKGDGYVADYNEKEGSCEWVHYLKNAHGFKNLIAAAKAVSILNLEGAEIIGGVSGLSDLLRF